MSKKERMKTPLTYYGGKQSLAQVILPFIPKHQTYVEPFVGGGAIFWAKPPSKVEVINDYNRELINFYEVCKNDFVELEKLIRISLHSRSLHNDAQVIYNHPHLFSRLQRAWAVWILCNQSFSSKINGSWGYDTKFPRSSGRISNRRNLFTEDYAIRLQNVQIENTDALRIINSRDYEQAFHYCDPPYFNTDCGHYNGYALDDYLALLKCLSGIRGKFLLSSYPSIELTEFAKEYKWHSISLHRKVRVDTKRGGSKKKKIEVITANYELKNQFDYEQLQHQ